MYTPPGYVPRQYHYRPENMGRVERYVFEKLKMALHSTTRQRLEGYDSELKGSYMSRTSGSSRNDEFTAAGTYIKPKRYRAGGGGEQLATRNTTNQHLKVNSYGSKVSVGSQARFGGSRIAATSHWSGSQGGPIDDGIVVFEQSEEGEEFL